MLTSIWGVSGSGNSKRKRVGQAGVLDPPRGGRLYDVSPAGWQSGYAEDCKSSYSGSIPLPASRGIAPRVLGALIPGSSVGRASGC